MVVVVPVVLVDTHGKKGRRALCVWVMNGRENSFAFALFEEGEERVRKCARHAFGCSFV